MLHLHLCLPHLVRPLRLTLLFHLAVMIIVLVTFKWPKVCVHGISSSKLYPCSTIFHSGIDIHVCVSFDFRGVHMNPVFYFCCCCCSGPSLFIILYSCYKISSLSLQMRIKLTFGLMRRIEFCVCFADFL